MKRITGKIKLLLGVLFFCSIALAAKIQDNTLIVGDQNAGVDKEIQLGDGSLKWDQATSKMQISDDGIGFSSISDLSGNAASLIENAGFASSVATSALTIDLKVADGSTDPTSGNLVKIAFRNLVATSGAYNIRTISSARTIVVPSGATLGHSDATDGFVYLYAINNAGVVELAVSSDLKDESSRITTTTIDATADDDGIYSTTGRTNVPFRLLARLKSNQTTAGTWDAVMLEISPDAPMLTSILNAKIGTGESGVVQYGAVIQDSGTCAVTRTIGGAWIDSIVDGGTGDCDITLSASFVDSVTFPICTAMGNGQPFEVIIFSVTATTFTINMRDSSGTATNGTIHLTCMAKN